MLLNLPHRQFVFALPKALRVFFRHDRRLFGHVSRLIYRIIQEFYQQAAGRPIRTGVIIAHQTFGDMLRWNPHFHSIVLEGGFDEQGTFVYIPLGHLETLTELLRRRVIALLVAHKLLDRRFARNMLSWRHSGFSVDNSVRILDRGVQRSLAEYISRPAISLKKIRYEPFKGRVLFHTTYSDYFKRWECQRQKSCTSSTLWTSLPSSEIACGNSTAYPTGAGATHSSLWFVLLAHQGSLDPHALRSTAGAIRLDEP